MTRVETPSPLGIYQLKQEVRSWHSTPGLLRPSLGIGPGECLLISLWQSGTVEEVQTLRQALIEQFQKVWAISFTAGVYNSLKESNFPYRHLYQVVKK
jgi:hypothetical protein